MTAPTVRVHRDGTVTADGKAIGWVYRTDVPSQTWAATDGAVMPLARTRTRREAVSALLDHTYGKDRWT